MTPVRVLPIAMIAVALLIDAHPMAWDKQFPRGLMSGESRSQTCTIETRPVSFGTYDPTEGTDVDAVGQVIYNCGNFTKTGIGGSAKAIRIELETGASNQYTTRTMFAGGGASLEYNLYLDATHRTIWGNGTNGTDVYVDTKPPNRTPVVVAVFGRIRGGQDVATGQYVDQMLARIVF